MRERMKKKKNMIIGGLLAVVFLMSVGYAAFASNLSITGTASTTNSWNILITNISSTVTGSATDTTVNKQPNSLTADISAELQSPGDKVTYEITVENSGSLNAKLETVTMTESNNEAVIFTKKGIEQGSVLNSNTTQTLIVIIEYNPEVTEQPSNLNASTTITFNYVQSTEEYANELYTVEYYSKSYYLDENNQFIIAGQEKIYEKQVHFDESGLIINPEDFNIKHLGYTFMDWYSKDYYDYYIENNDIAYSDLVGNDKTTKTVQIYAHWAVKKVEVKYQTGFGGTGISPRNIGWNTSKIVQATPSRQAYTFVEWNTKEDGTGLTVTNDTKMREVVNYNDTIESITLYAIWQDHHYTINYDSQGGSAVPSKTVIWREQGLNASAPTKAGYTFKEWNTKADGTGTTITDETKYYSLVSTDIDGQETTLYAIWE